MRRLLRRAMTRKRSEAGYVAIVTAAMTLVLFGMAAFAVDVGRWYVTGKEAQRAADAGALAGVPNLPGKPSIAMATAQEFTAANDFPDGGAITVVPGVEPGAPTRLRVTISKTVDNIFGGLLGVPHTTITRTAVADYAGPVPLGSPCNEYGNDPDGSGVRSANCDDTGEFWANVGSPQAPKQKGDAYQDNNCSLAADNCDDTNTDYDPDGYFYSVTLDRDIDNLAFEVYDPALIHVGDLCDASPQLDGAVNAVNSYVTDESTRYAKGADKPDCTGDNHFGGTTPVRTRFSVRNPGPNPWEPLSFEERPGCAREFPGFNGNLKGALDESDPGYDDYVAEVFRRWVPVCTITSAQKGTYLIQVKTNGIGADDADGHNRFALRAYSTSDTSANDDIAVSGYNKMAMYANLPDATTKFHLARVPSGAAGQILNVRLYDVGDSSTTGTITVLAPEDSGVTFSNCTGTGPIEGNLPTCSIDAHSSTHQGRWQVISVPIPSGYSCDDNDKTKCWVKLQYAYGSDNQPADTTSWQASIEGDPVRLVE